MTVPFVIDNQQHRLADALNELLTQSVGKPLDIATAYFAISGYRLVKTGLHQIGVFRLLLGAEPHTGIDVGLRPNAEALKKRFQGDLEVEPFTEATLKLVEELIAFLRADKVEVRLYDKGFLHAKAYLFHQDRVGPHNRADRLRPFAAIVGSSNCTGPGLVSNRELNLVHRVILPIDKAVDHEAAQRVGYLERGPERETVFDPSGKGKPAAFPNRRLHTVTYDLGAAYGGLYDEIAAAIDSLSLAPYKLEAYKKPSAIRDEEQHKFEEGREEGLVGIFKTRFLKHLESSIEAFRLSLRRALTFEETYKDYLLDRKVVSSKDFQKAIRFLAWDEEDDVVAGSLADELDAVGEAKAYIESLPTVDLNEYDLRKLTHDVEVDVKLFKSLYERTAARTPKSAYAICSPKISWRPCST